MIKTSTQLKALVRNMSQGDSTKAQIIIRNYIMERFLERLSLSSFKEYFIIKGGILIASIVGLENLSTMDIDSSVKNTDLTLENIEEMIFSIINIKLQDNIEFRILDITPIMNNLDYPGIRVSLEATIDKMRTPLKLDISTGDKITPSEVEYQYPLMFENRSISIMTYSLETILAEKFETIISRGVLNSRMRDFYDIYALLEIRLLINEKDLNSAIRNTFTNRGSVISFNEWGLIIYEIKNDEDMMRLWKSYQNKFDYAHAINWGKVIESINKLVDIIEL